MSLESIFLVAGGLGLFLFGMKMMSGGIELIAGERLQSILQKATSNRVFAVIVGILATIAINSSTATTIMTVSFVNSGLMNLTQAIGIILGANVGTTFSAQLIAFRIDTVAPLFIFVGIIMYLFVKKRSIKNIGYVILGFGILFFGITVMGTPLRGIADQPGFNAMLTAFENPFLALVAGFAFTAVVQSSSATMGLLVTMHLNGVPIPFETSAFIILGTNIGTSITTVLASIPANRQSKRAALFHIMFDIIGSAVFGTLVFVFPAILQWFQHTWAETARQVAMFHTLYNFATMFLILPFIGPVAKLMEKIVPLKADGADRTYEKKLMYLDSADAKLLQSPGVAVLNAHLELCRMGKIANENLKLALEAFFQKDVEKARKVVENEDILNYLNHSISAKLVWINNMRLSIHEAKKVGEMFRTLSDMERIGDHAENIAEYTVVIAEGNLRFTEAAIEELKELSEVTVALAVKAMEVFERQDEPSLSQIVALEDEVDELSVDFIENHIERLKEEACAPQSGVFFTDMITDLERCADHANNIAFTIIPEKAKKAKRLEHKQAQQKSL
ncbi:MAG: Na/Pi cotransporter family protein [Lachnospiraceae bacterium]|nr:Na/Pi cotransporter family protein [Lachnospiraceae bacterium]